MAAGFLTNSATVVSNGLFTVTLDFGAGVFDGTTYWLQIGVRTNGVGGFNALSPRQQLTPAPYAIMANTASNLLGTLPAAQLSGTVPLAQLPGAVVTNNQTSVSLNGSFTGNGGALTNIQLSAVGPPGTLSLVPVPLYFIPTNYRVSGSRPVSVVAADVNGDGKLDLISANHTMPTR